MQKLNEAFQGYLNVFKQLPIPNKRQEIIRAVNEITAVFDSLENNSNIKLSYLKSKEITELKDGKESEDDFLKALLFYIENAKNLIGQYFDDKI